MSALLSRRSARPLNRPAEVLSHFDEGLHYIAVHHWVLYVQMLHVIRTLGAEEEID